MRTKPVDANADTGLKRCLTALDLTLLGIGCIIGTGIFVVTGVAAAQAASLAIHVCNPCRLAVAPARRVPPAPERLRER